MLAVKGQRRRPAVDHGVGLRAALHGQARGADSPLPRRSPRRRDGGVLSAGRLRRQSRRRVDRYAVARLPAVRSRRPPASRLGDRARGERQRQGEAGGVQRALRAHDRLGALAASRLRAGADAAPRRRGEPRLRWDHSRRPRPVYLGPDATGVLPEQHPHHRPDGRVHRRTSAAGESATVRRRARLAEAAAEIAPSIAAAILPYLRGVVSSNRRTIAHWDAPRMR